MNKSTIGKKEKQSLVLRLLFRFSFLPLFLGLLVLLPAGTFHFWNAYLYFGILVVPMTGVLLYFINRDPAFLERRTRSSEKEQQQLLISYLSLVVFISGFMIPGFDHRFGWSAVPLWLVIPANVMVLLGYSVIFSVFRENSYASNIVEVTEGQQVITTGPYTLVRHPMYLGVLIMFIPTPIALGSYWGLIPFAFLPLTMVLRLLQEEKLLLKELNGYVSYCQQTRYRLIPYIW